VLREISWRIRREARSVTAPSQAQSSPLSRAAFRQGYTIVKDYVRLRKLSQSEMFVPLAHPPGDAQADFGEAMVVIAGGEQKAHYLAMDLPQSDDCFVMAFPVETTEAFLEGHNHAFAYFGGVPRTILYDNTKIAVARILGDGTRTNAGVQ
jgi:transposase